jgi:hypothetical protein
MGAMEDASCEETNFHWFNVWGSGDSDPSGRTFSKAWVCGRLLVEVVGSNPAGAWIS